MKSKSSLVRRVVSAALVAALLASAGCSWLRGRSGYENSPESRPLEVPPDLDRPAADTSMQVPAVSAAAAASASAAARGPVTGESFVIADSLENAWRRLGLALERIDGVSVDDRAQLLSVYNVTFEGESFLVKAAAEGEGTRVTTVSASGEALTTGAAGRLLALLKARLG